MNDRAQPSLEAARTAGLHPDEGSRRTAGAAVLWFDANARALHAVAPADDPVLRDLEGSTTDLPGGLAHRVGLRSSVNAAALREILPNLRPRPLGLATSAGFGDRLGIATPGHVRALETVLRRHDGAAILPIFAQQSIREMARTNRTPQDVMDDATWGAFEAGWAGPVGADADHLKTPEHIDRCVAAGFAFFTVDPGDHVVDGASDASATELDRRLDDVPWAALDISRDELLRRYGDWRLDAEGLDLAFDRGSLIRAVVKYGGALAHAARMYRHLAAKDVPFELEVSVDETDTPTTVLEHAFIALELARLGVRWVSLAPRFVGRFEKGVDYRGDRGELLRTLDAHAKVARALGPYKISLHSGSDKFLVYGPIAEATRGMVHLKTAGTSYLEALRVAAVHAPELFRDILALARERFAEDRATYHVSARLDAVPEPTELADGDLAGLLDQDDARQVLHVTFGSALDRFRSSLVDVLEHEREAHYDGLARHFEKHLAPFAPHARSDDGAGR